MEKCGIRGYWEARSLPPKEIKMTDQAKTAKEIALEKITDQKLWLKGKMTREQFLAKWANR